MALGQYKDGAGLFVKRQDSDGKPIGKNGWHHWQAKSGGGHEDDDLREFGA